MEDFIKALTFEIKQDIATRYFGFRKRIETESSQYLEELRTAKEKYSIGIAFDLQRMRCLLQNTNLFRSFVVFTTIPDEIGSSLPVPPAPGQWRQLFFDLRGEGFTRRRRHRNLVYKVYASLVGNVSAYRDIYLRLTEEHEDICREIELFHRKNDLSGILTFLRDIDNPSGSGSGLLLRPDQTSLAGGDMEKELRIVPPPAVVTYMPALGRLPSLPEAKPTLDDLINQAYPLFDQAELAGLPI